MTGSPNNHPAVRPDWLATCIEEALEPALPVIDAHHHLYDRPGSRYLLHEYLDDIARSGHAVRASVIVQARAMLRAHGPDHLRPIGETEFANGIAAMSASGTYGPARVGAAIVGYADMRLGDAVRPVLERHIAAAGGAPDDGGRFRGVRHSLTWDADASLWNPVYPITEELMDTPQFRAAFAQLAPLGLGFDAWVLFPQLPRLASLARAFEETPIVLDHCGGVARIGAYQGRRDDVFRRWQGGMAELARCPNVMVKLSGLGMPLSGFGFAQGERAPSSAVLADAWRPWIEICIEAFGARRCMWASNFPVDKGSCSFGNALNAIKRITAGASAGEKESIFWRSSARFYRLAEAGLYRDVFDR